MRTHFSVVSGSLAVIAAALVASSASAAGQRSIDRVDVQSGADAAEIVIRGDHKLDFSLFRLSSPTRVVIDVANADVSATDVPARFADGAMVTGITTTQFRGRNGPVGRVVVVLRGEAEVDARPVGDTVVVSARRTGAPASPVTAPPRSSAAPASDVPVIELVGDAGPAQRASRLLGVDARVQGEGSIVRIKTDGEVARYEVEEAQDPSRLIVDLYGVTVDRHSEVAFDQSAVVKARIGKHADKVRVVLDGRAGVPRYDVASTGEGLAIMFSGAAATTAAVDLKGLTFDKKNGFWRLKLDLGGTVAVRTVKNAPDEKVIALDGARVADALLGLRAGDGPVSGIVLSRDEAKAGSVRVKLALAADVEHSVWQRDGAVYWDVRAAGASAVLANGSPERVQPSAAPLTTGTVTLAHEGVTAAAYRGKRITIDLMEADIVNVVRLIGDVSGKNVVVGEDVKGKVTLKLKSVPWDQALDVILKTKDLGQETRGGIIRVVPQAKLDAERESRLKMAEEREKKLPTTVRLIPVNYAVAKELVPQVKGLLSARGTVTSDERTNVLIVEDIRDNLEQSERLVRTLDTQTPQVLIEARMVEGQTSFTRTLGIQWGGGLFFSQRGGNPTGLLFPNNVGIAGGADNFQTLQSGQAGVFSPSNFAVNLPAQSVNSAIGLNLGSIGNFGFLNARLSAAEQSGQAKIVSAPRVTTLNNKRARIAQGTEFNFPTVTLNQVNVTTVRAALELDVTPHVTADGSILMKLEISNNVPDFGNTVIGADTPPINTKEAETEMLVRDGDTAVIGGVFTRTTGESYNQTPFLGSIPILGWLFKNYSEVDNRSEMLVFITPRIVNRRSATPGGM